MGNYANGSVGNSYGMIYTTNKILTFALRTSISSTTAIMRIEWNQMATSPTIGLSRIPTEFALRILTMVTRFTCLQLVMSTAAGMVFMLTIPAGDTRSPSTINSDHNFYIFRDGASNNNGGVSQYGSYGRYNSPDTRYITFWWVGLNGVADSWMHNDVAYSYGIFII